MNPNADPTAPPTFSKTNIIAAAVIAALSAGVLACQLLGPRWPIETAITSLFIIVFAGVLHVPLQGLVRPPVTVVYQVHPAVTSEQMAAIVAASDKTSVANAQGLIIDRSPLSYTAANGTHAQDVPVPQQGAATPVKAE